MDFREPGTHAPSSLYKLLALFALTLATATAFEGWLGLGQPPATTMMLSTGTLAGLLSVTARVFWLPLMLITLVLRIALGVLVQSETSVLFLFVDTVVVVALASSWACAIQRFGPGPSTTAG